jgi:tripartite-type tricarboxylate transporter receptor subunit TctC
MLKQRIFIVLAAIAATGLHVAPAGAADWTPAGPITLQIGFGAGGSTDTIGRVIAASMEQDTGWDVIVENKPGGGGVAMFSTLSQAEPDGLTIGMGVTVPIHINLATRGDKLPFKADSFDYLATVARAQLALIAKSDAPYDDLAGLIDYAKTHDGANIAFDAPPQKLLMTAVGKQSGTHMKMVSHNSGAEVVQSVLGGHVDAGFAAGAHLQYLHNGDVKMLASANAERHSYAPDTPTVIEQGYNYYVDPWFYIAAPKGLPDDAKAALVQALDAAINSAEATEVIENAMQTEPVNIGPDATLEMLVKGVDDVGALLKAAQ